VNNSPVQIDLYQDSPDGPALLKTIATAAPDTGEYIWRPELADLPTLVNYGTHGFRIQISLVNDPMVLDEVLSLQRSGGWEYLLCR